MTSSTFLPRKSDSFTGRPRRSGIVTSGADARLQEAAAQRLNLTEAPHARIDVRDDGLAGFFRERRCARVELR